jgi:hypothetical protein
LIKGKQPEGFRTDLVINTPQENLKVLTEIGCTTDVRTDVSQPDKCIINFYKPMYQRKTPKGVAPDPLIAYQRYVDSIICLAEYKGFEYDAVLRSDVDTFLMPGFASWVPQARETLIAGNGGYGHDNANAHLAYVSKILKLDTKEGLGSLGSSWFGDTKLMVAAAQLSISVMRWMQTQEFNTFEKCCSGTLGWPHWHWPVLSMYGNHVALNQELYSSI